MASITAFDSKDFKRSNRTGDLKFFSPLGCGITVSKPEEFQKCYIEKLNQLFQDFNISPMCGCFASSEYFPSAGRPKTFKLADELLKSVQKYIDSVFISYVVLPSKLIPTVEVRKYKEPKREVKTLDFLRELSSAFSYITAFTYCNRNRGKSEKIFIDGFRGKLTNTWTNFVDTVTPVVYPRGDECNVYISTADMIASLTDKKIYDNHLRLTEEDIKEVWKDYSFDVDVRFLDSKILPHITEISNDLIDATRYHAKPTIFLKADDYPIAEIQKLSVYSEATLLARDLNGCLQGFDKKN